MIANGNGITRVANLSPCNIDETEGIIFDFGGPDDIAGSHVGVIASGSDNKALAPIVSKGRHDQHHTRAEFPTRFVISYQPEFW